MQVLPPILAGEPLLNGPGFIEVAKRLIHGMLRGLRFHPFGEQVSQDTGSAPLTAFGSGLGEVCGEPGVVEGAGFLELRDDGVDFGSVCRLSPQLAA